MTVTRETLSVATPDGIIRNPQVDFDMIGNGPWDGRRRSYIPRDPVPIDPRVTLHEEFDRGIDPVTHQVLRSRFWQQNLEHGDVLTRVSGSLVIVGAKDFATAMLTENGDTFVVGPNVQYFTSLSDLVVKWTLENRSAAGIEDGDIFLQNDPYIGTAQQVDTAVYAPVFWEGRIFSWIYNCSHIGDLGGVDAGGWAVNARDIFDEATTVPPIRIVRRGVSQDELVEAFSRQSRDPTMIVIGLKGAVAGIESTRRQMLETLERYGPRTVKGVMRKSIADTSAVVSRRLKAIPDGTWRERVLVCGISGDDRTSHEEVISLTKNGDRVTCTNEGTSPQFGAGNSPYAVLRSSVVSAISTMLAYDQFGCTAGVANHVMFHPVFGTRNAPNHPAACSAILSTLIGVNVAGLVAGKMVLSGPPELRKRANASGAMAVPMSSFAFGITEDGRYVGVDAYAGGGGAALAGGLGAFADRDGVDAGGSWFMGATTAGNIELAEEAGVMLVAYRSESIDSGGPGRWRGGNGCVLAFKPHKIHTAVTQYSLIDPGTNTSRGLGGGFAGLAGNFLRADGVGASFVAGRMPRGREDVAAAGAVERMHPRGTVVASHDDLLVNEYSGGGGFGDPLTREPRRVADDVARMVVSREAAERHYGVSLDADGNVDLDATEQLRQSIRKGRLEGATPVGDPIEERQAPSGIEPLIAGAAGSVDVVVLDEEPVWSCSSCSRVLGPVTGDFKAGAVFEQAPGQEIDSHLYVDPAEYGDPDVVLRRYYCPSCASLIGQEFCHTRDAPLVEITLDRMPDGF